MTITITIATDNEAFTPDPDEEVARILREVVTMFDKYGAVNSKLRDFNGNTVGAVRYEIDEDEDETDPDDDMPAVRHTSCLHCGQDIEGVEPFPADDWRDRGNNTHCSTGQLHEPVVVP